MMSHDARMICWEVYDFALLVPEVQALGLFSLTVYPVLASLDVVSPSTSKKINHISAVVSPVLPQRRTDWTLRAMHVPYHTLHRREEWKQ